MPRPPRVDEKGLWHHISNGGVAKRTLFETSRDIRYLLSLFARMVRAGRIEVHAFVVMANHYHVVIRSLDGEISRTMQWIEARYAEYFNRTRDRTGSVFGGRFWSKIVETGCYWGTVVRYVHGNPVRAKIVAAAENYPHGSARYLVSGRVPRWLQVGLVSELLADEIECIQRGEPGQLGLPDGEAGEFACRLVERRLGCERDAPDPLDDLVRSSPRHVQRWMRERARMADGRAAPPGLLLVSPVHRRRADPRDQSRNREPVGPQAPGAAPVRRGLHPARRPGAAHLPANRPPPPSLRIARGSGTPEVAEVVWEGLTPLHS